MLSGLVYCRYFDDLWVLCCHPLPSGSLFAYRRGEFVVPAAPADAQHGGEDVEDDDFDDARHVFRFTPLVVDAEHKHRRQDGHAAEREDDHEVNT